VSPSRSKRRQPLPKQHSRQEIVTAALAALGVVVFTVVAIWMLRPGEPFVPGTGGIAHRQPRATWLVVGAIALAIAVTVWLLRSRRFANRRPLALSLALGIIVVVAVVIGIVWPSGLLRHYQSLTPETVPSTAPAPSTTAAGATTTAPGGTTAPSATTAPAGTTAATTPTSSTG
jgi:hypothetical protein